MRYLSKFVVLVGVLGIAAAAGAQQPYTEQEDEEYNQPGYQPPPQQQPAEVQYGYVGVHPFPHEVGSGFCYQSGAHFHNYAPFDQHLFREAGGYFYFIGDVGDFGYAQTAYGYNGNHPIPSPYGGGYCYISWNHRHHYAPPASLSFNFVGGYYTYAGGWDPLYWQHRDRYYGYYNGYYRNSYYGNRYYSTRPSHIYRPTIGIGMPGVYGRGGVGVTVGAPGGYRGGVTVGAPGYRGGVTVGAPGVGVRGPGVYVAPPRVYAPAPVYQPRPTYVAPPRVYAPAPRVYAPAPRVYAPAPTYVAPSRGPVYAPAPGRVVGPPRGGRFR